MSNWPHFLFALPINGSTAFIPEFLISHTNLVLGCPDDKVDNVEFKAIIGNGSVPKWLSYHRYRQ